MRLPAHIAEKKKRRNSNDTLNECRTRLLSFRLFPFFATPNQLTRLKRQKGFRPGETSILRDKSLGIKAERLAPVRRIHMNGPLHRDNHRALWYVVAAYLGVLNMRTVSALLQFSLVTPRKI